MNQYSDNQKISRWNKSHDDEKTEAPTCRRFQLLMGKFPENLASSLATYLHDKTDKSYIHELLGVDRFWTPSGDVQNAQDFLQCLGIDALVSVACSDNERMKIPLDFALQSEHLTTLLMKDNDFCRFSSADLRKILEFLPLASTEKFSDFFLRHNGKHSIPSEFRQFANSKTVCELGVYMDLAVKFQVKSLLRLCHWQLAERVDDIGFDDVLDLLPFIEFDKQLYW